MAELPPDLRCWARRDDAPPFERQAPGIQPWAYQCGKEPADDLGLCAHHRAVLVGQAVPAATRPAGGGS